MYSRGGQDGLAAGALGRAAISALRSTGKDRQTAKGEVRGPEPDHTVALCPCAHVIAQVILKESRCRALARPQGRAPRRRARALPPAGRLKPAPAAPSALGASPGSPRPAQSSEARASGCFCAAPRKRTLTTLPKHPPPGEQTTPAPRPGAAALASAGCRSRAGAAGGGPFPPWKVLVREVKRGLSTGLKELGARQGLMRVIALPSRSELLFAPCAISPNARQKPKGSMVQDSCSPCACATAYGPQDSPGP